MSEVRPVSERVRLIPISEGEATRLREINDYLTDIAIGDYEFIQSLVRRFGEGITESEKRALMLAGIFGEPDEKHDTLESAKAKLRAAFQPRETVPGALEEER